MSGTSISTAFRVTLSYTQYAAVIIIFHPPLIHHQQGSGANVNNTVYHRVDATGRYLNDDTTAPLSILLLDNGFASMDAAQLLLRAAKSCFHITAMEAGF